VDAQALWERREKEKRKKEKGKRKLWSGGVFIPFLPLLTAVNIPCCHTVHTLWLV
jgi:hypothetical protein